MKKINLLIAALHAGALALAAAPGVARAQDAPEIRAYMNALSLGTAEAMSDFLVAYPNSTLPGQRARRLDRRQPGSADGGHLR